MRIQSGQELYTKLFRLLGEQHEGGWACPWCKKLGVYDVEDESTSDRLFLSTKIEPNRHPIRFVCRQANDGVVNHHAVHSVEELFTEFSESLELAPNHQWEEIALQLFAIVGVSSGSRDIDHSKVFWNYLQVLNYHTAHNTYEEWGKLGFSKSTVDRLSLGVLPNGRLSIPVPYMMQQEPFGLRLESDSYVQRSRIAEGMAVTKSNPKYYWPGNGSLPLSMWYISGATTNPCRIFEGDTSIISSIEIWGDGPSATAMGGAGSWSTPMSEHLLARGHTQFHIYTDNDGPGKRYADLVVNAFKEASDKRGTDWDTLSFYMIQYPMDAPEKYDPRAVLLEYGPEKARELLESWMIPHGRYKSYQPPIGRVHAQYDATYAQSDFDNDYAKQKELLYDLQQLRGEDGRGLIYQEIGDFVANFKPDEEGNGRVLLIRSTPGVGKTRSAVRFAEDYARAYLAKRKRWANRAITRMKKLEQTEKVQKRIRELEDEHYKKLCVVFVGAFVDGFADLMAHSSDQTLWFDWQARNTATCQNMALVNQIINAGYGVMKTACIEGGLCPFRESCLTRIDGELQYLAQMDEVKYHPIVYLRHNHLYMAAIFKQAHLIIVDEDPSSVALDSIMLTASELKNFDAYQMLEGEEASVVNNVVEALIGSIEMWSLDAILMGRRLVDSLQMKSGFRTLHESAQYISEYSLLEKIANWRPYNLQKAPDGRIVKLLTILVKDILRDDDDWNGQIFIESNTISFYPMEPFKIEQKKPVVALDATGMAYKYQLCFNRPVPEFFAEVFPAHQKTFVITNTENTMTTLHDGIDKTDMSTALYGVRDSMTIAVQAKPQNLSVLGDLSNVPNSAIRESLKMILGLTAKHGQLLVVTYKTGRQFMETFINEHFPDYAPYIGWGHFRALRGLNVFENIPAVLVIGTFRVPTAKLHKDLIAFHKDDPDLLDLSLHRVDEYYHCTPWYYPTLTVGDARSTVQEYLHELEAGELQQVAGRIRAAVSEKDKYVYLMTARPAMPWSTYRNTAEYDPKRDRHFVTMQSAAWWWYEAQQSIQYVIQFIDQYGRMPTIRELAKTTGQSEWTARKILDYWNQGGESNDG